MKTIKIADAPNRAIDWLVAKAEYPGRRIDIGEDGHAVGLPPDDRNWFMFKPTTNPAQAWPIIEREGISLDMRKGEPPRAFMGTPVQHHPSVFAPKGQALLAAMRCFCISRYGEEAEVPEELLV